MKVNESINSFYCEKSIGGGFIVWGVQAGGIPDRTVFRCWKVRTLRPPEPSLDQVEGMLCKLAGACAGIKLPHSTHPTHGEADKDQRYRAISASDESVTRLGF